MDDPPAPVPGPVPETMTVPLPAIADLRVVELGRVGGGAGRDRHSRRLGCRRHQGGGTRAATRCATCSARSGWTATCPTPRTRSTTGASGRSCSTSARRTDRARMEELLADAHVFLTNLKPDVLDKFGLDADSTSARHPHLVYCSVSGYGLAGPEREPPELRPRRVLGSQRALVPARRRRTVERTRRDRRPHHVARERWPASSVACCSSARRVKGAWWRRRCCEPARTCSGWDLGLQSSLGKVARGEPREATQIAADERVPHRRRPVAVPHVLGSRPAPAECVRRARSRGPARPTSGSRADARCARTSAR